MKTKDMVLQTLIERGPLTAKQIADILGLEQSNAQWHLRDLRQMGQTHVERFIIEQDKKDTRIWAAGEGEDALKPSRFDRITKVTGKAPKAPTAPPMTEEQRERLQEEYQAREDAKRRKRLLADIKPFRDPWLWVLFQGEEACA